MEDSGSAIRSRIAQLVDQVVDEQPEYAHDAAELFCEMVDPVESEGARAAFFDFLAYDYVDEDGLTFLGRFAGDEPMLSGLDEECLFSSFWVLRQDPEAGTALLMDVADAGIYEVRDEEVSANPRWASGVLSLRLGRVDGEWLSVGKFVAHDNAALRVGTPYEDVFGHPPVQGRMAFAALLNMVDVCKVDSTREASFRIWPLGFDNKGCFFIGRISSTGALDMGLSTPMSR